MNHKTLDTLMKGFAILVGGILIVYSLTLIYPLFWAIINSAKDEVDYGTNLFNFPSKWQWSNFTDVWQFMKVERLEKGKGVVVIYLTDMIYNSLFRCVAEPFVELFFKVMCAYVLAKYVFPGSKFIFRLGIILMIIPIIAGLGSSLTIHKALGTYDNMYALLISRISTCFMGTEFLIIYSAFKGVPSAYMEAAKMDGASNYRIMFSIMIPMQLPLIVTYYVLGFLGTWNDYSTSLTYLPSYPNVAYGLFMFQTTATSGAEGASSAMILAGYVIVMVPTALLYFSCHKIITSKIIIGGLKG